MTICAFVVAALAWSYFGRVDIIATAQGKIQPIGRTKVVEPLETGKVAASAWSNGARSRPATCWSSSTIRRPRRSCGRRARNILRANAEAIRRKTALAAARAQRFSLARYPLAGRRPNRLAPARGEGSR